MIALRLCAGVVVHGYQSEGTQLRSRSDGKKYILIRVILQSKSLVRTPSSGVIYAAPPLALPKALCSSCLNLYEQSSKRRSPSSIKVISGPSIPLLSSHFTPQPQMATARSPPKSSAPSCALSGKTPPKPSCRT